MISPWRCCPQPCAAARSHRGQTPHLVNGGLRGNTLHWECPADSGLAGQGWSVPPISCPQAQEARVAGAQLRDREGLEGMSRQRRKELGPGDGTK